MTPESQEFLATFVSESCYYWASVFILIIHVGFLAYKEGAARSEAVRKRVSMASPFSTIEELNSAIDGPTEGAIYTFANTPAINEIALLVAVGLLSLIAADHRQITSSPQDRKTARPSGVSGWPAI